MQHPVSKDIPSTPHVTGEPSSGTRSGRRARRRLARGLQGLVLACVLAGFVVVAVAVGSGGWQIRPILSGSMRPGLPIGGVVVTQRVPTASLQVRDVAVFHPPTDPRIDYVHRIISLRHTAAGVLIRTQGDANLYPDPWTIRVQGRWAYVARFTVPLVGYPAVWAHSPAGRRDLLITAGLLALALVGSAVAERRRQARVGCRGTAGSSTDSPPVGDRQPVGDPAAK